jgi:SAM-dependent methyltransferase
LLKDTILQGKQSKRDESDASMQYWDVISNTMADDPPSTVWRRHSDAVNGLLLARWLHKNRYHSILKTDLFDESIGVGLCSFLSNYCDELHGIDISEVCVKAATSRYPALQAHTADVRDLPYPNEYFDCIVSNSTLDHFPALEEIGNSLEELNRVLRPGAELIITLDNLMNPLIWLRSILPQQWLSRAGLLPYYVGETLTTRGLHKMLIKAGFEISASSVSLHCPRVAAIPLSSWIQKNCAERGQQRWLRLLMGFEWLTRTPLRHVTGYFIAVHAKKPENRSHGLEGGGTDVLSSRG